MLFNKIIIFLIFLSFSTHPSFVFFESCFAQNSESKDDKIADLKRIEQLFIWKVSDELKLSTNEEIKFRSTLIDLNKKKQNLSQEYEDILLTYKQIANQKKTTEFKKKILNNLKEQSQLNTLEINELSKFLSEQKIMEYLLIKKDISDKVRASLQKSVRSEGKKLPPPKVIED